MVVNCNFMQFWDIVYYFWLPILLYSKVKHLPNRLYCTFFLNQLVFYNLKLSITTFFIRLLLIKHWITSSFHTVAGDVRVSGYGSDRGRRDYFVNGVCRALPSFVAFTTCRLINVRLTWIFDGLKSLIMFAKFYNNCFPSKSEHVCHPGWP